MTPELTKYAERLAEEFELLRWDGPMADDDEKEGRAQTRKDFLWGFRAAQEVFALRGRLCVFEEQLIDACEEDSPAAVYWVEKFNETKARLASLLEGKSDE